MRWYLAIFILFIFLSGCEENFYNNIKKEDVLQNGGLSREFEKLEDMGIRGYSKNGDNIIFYVEEPTEQTREVIEKGLIKLFGVKLNFTLEEASKYDIKYGPSQ